MTGVVFRAAEMRDAVLLMHLAENSPGAQRWSEKTWEQVLASAADGEHRLVCIAERTGEAVAFGVCGAAADQAEIENLAVSADARRQGMGTRLCEELVGWARERGAMQMLLEVRASNAGALALYRSLGFTVQAVRRGYYREPTEDAVVMLRKL